MGPRGSAGRNPCPLWLNPSGSRPPVSGVKACPVSSRRGRGYPETRHALDADAIAGIRQRHRTGLARTRPTIPRRGVRRGGASAGPVGGIPRSARSTILRISGKPQDPRFPPPSRVPKGRGSIPSANARFGGVESPASFTLRSQPCQRGKSSVFRLFCAVRGRFSVWGFSSPSRLRCRRPPLPT